MNIQSSLQSPSSKKRTMRGSVVSAKMQKTVVVSVTHFKKHPKYEKRYRVTKRYKAHHDDSRVYHPGEEVLIEEMRPVSKDKRWHVVKVLTEAPRENTPQETGVLET